MSTMTGTMIKGKKGIKQGLSGEKVKKGEVLYHGRTELKFGVIKDIDDRYCLCSYMGKEINLAKSQMKRK